MPMVFLTILDLTTSATYKGTTLVIIRALTILGRQRDGDGHSWYIINRLNLIQFQKLKTWVLWLGRILLHPV
jgi:hypothetical protein